MVLTLRAVGGGGTPERATVGAGPADADAEAGAGATAEPKEPKEPAEPAESAEPTEPIELDHDRDPMTRQKAGPQ